MIERIFHCDGPDCTEHVQTASPRPVAAFITVTDQCGGSRIVRHFCSWDCVLRFAATVPPSEYVVDGANQGEV